jgi:hypothetical protein
LEESDFREDPRRLDEILEAESEMFDRIWYNRSLNYDFQPRQAADEAGSRSRRGWPERHDGGSRSALVGSRIWAAKTTSSAEY